MSSITKNSAQAQVIAPADTEAGNRAILWLLLDRHDNAKELLKWVDAADFPKGAQRLIVEAATRCKAAKIKPTLDQIEDELLTEAGKVTAPEESADYQAAIFLKEELIREKPVHDEIEELKNQRIAEIRAAKKQSNPPIKPGEKLKKPEKFAPNEIGNGQRFAAKHSESMRFCKVRESWLHHKSGRWQMDEAGEAEQRAKEIERDVTAEAARETHDDQRARLLKHALTLTKRATRETMLKDAASEPGIMVTPEQFDRNPNLFNLANVTLDLETFETYPHRAADLLTLQSPVSFDANAECPTWRACMARWVPDEPTRDYMQDTFGISLSGRVFEEFFNFLYGGGDNGKSTLLRILEQLCGTYWHKTQAETIMQARDKRQPEAPAPALLALKGARLVTVHEIDRTHTLNATLVKDLTGRDAITARGLFEKRPTTFEPQFTLWMFGNGKPQIKDTSGGMWRRVRLIDFSQPIPQHERDPHLSDKLRAELPGILNWAIEGLKRVHERGLIVPDAVKAATAEYQAEQDPLAGFVEECCIVGPQYKTKSAELWESWSEWCRNNGEREGSQRAFGMELKRRKFTASKSGDTRFWVGIGLIADFGTQGTQKTQLPGKFPVETSHVQTFSEEVSEVSLVSQNKEKISVLGYGTD